MTPVAINYHLLKFCNSKCSFCFATFKDVEGQLSLPDAKRLIDVLAEAGAQKLNFAGGEPTLHPHLGPLLRHGKRAGLVTSVVTNGFGLRQLLEGFSPFLDWAGLSIDSMWSKTPQAALGRGHGSHVAQTIALAAVCAEAGVKVKLNTVVTAMTVHEDMTPLIRRIGPERWKVFQVLAMGGQNDGRVDDLLVSAADFAAFVSRHDRLLSEGLSPVVEDNDAMLGSYAMIDPEGRFFGNSTGRHVYSAPILTAGVGPALAQVGFSPKKFESRGGRYSW